MPRNGSGTYSLPEADYVAGTTITASAMNNNLGDIESALTASVAKDGQTTPTANLPMGGFRHLNVGNATLRTNYAAAGQAQDSAFQWGSIAAYTTASNVYAITLAPAITAYAGGQSFTFRASNANVGSQSEVNINSAGKKAIKTFDNRTLRGGEIPAGTVQRITYDGTAFRLPQVPAEEFIEAITASNSTQVDFILPSGFNHFKVYLTAVLPDTDSAVLRAKMSADSGSSYAGISTNYNQMVTYPSGGAVVSTNYVGSNVQIGIEQGSLTRGILGCVLFWPGDALSTAAIKAEMGGLNTTSPWVAQTYANRSVVGAQDGLRFQFSGSALIASGRFTLTGYR